MNEFAASSAGPHYKLLRAADCVFDFIYLVLFSVFLMPLSFGEIISHRWQRNKMRLFEIGGLIQGKTEVLGASVTLSSTKPTRLSAV